ncbi:hypothetical protein [Pseudomonas libanensis]|uniref:hypothetical protein n=1 Tax=Pseudomonas libanensis TaxID=75588 RepID=UPI0012E39F5C|nr:hypothetical protein [Pseudomonas libanensis]
MALLRLNGYLIFPKSAHLLILLLAFGFAGRFLSVSFTVSLGLFFASCSVTYSPVTASRYLVGISAPLTVCRHGGDLFETSSQAYAHKVPDGDSGYQAFPKQVLTLCRFGSFRAGLRWLG